MDLRTILDADMGTVAGWLRAGLAWWADELRAMVPARWRRPQLLATRIDWRGPDDWSRTGPGAVLPVLIDPARCLVRTMDLPALPQADLQRLVVLDADRIFPLPADRIVVAARPDPERRGQVAVAAFPRDAAAAMLADLAAQAIRPTTIGVADPAQPGAMAIDFGPALAQAGLIAPAVATRRIWWVIAGFLFALNLGLLVLRDMQAVARVEALVEAQAPAVRAARIMTDRIGSTQRAAAQLAARRADRDALAMLAAITRALPEKAWVQRLIWDGESIRVSGYRRADADVIGALRRSGRFADVRLAQSDAAAELPTGLPFDLTARVIMSSLPPAGEEARR